MRAKRIIRRAVWTLLALATLIALFYSEEDWRGARAWRAAEAEYARSGGVLDFNRLMPLPVPDGQNLAALPVFASQPDPSSKSSLLFPAFDKALHRQEHFLDLPIPGNWARGERPDIAKINAGVATLYSGAFKTQAAPSSSLAQFEALFPVVVDLRNASADRPDFILNIPFDRNHPFSSPIGPVADEIQLARVLSLDAILALDEDQAETALADIRVLKVLASGINPRSSLLGGLVSIGVATITSGVIHEGLAQHAWMDSQLAQLQKWLLERDDLVLLQTSIRGELAQQINGLSAMGPLWTRTFGKHGGSDSDSHSVIDFYPPWPAGWIDLNKSKLVSFDSNYVKVTNPTLHRVFPKLAGDLAQKRNRALLFGHSLLPSSFLFFLMSDAENNIASTCAKAQVGLDQSVLACGLERYRLAHGRYPGSLGALQPAYCAELPCDPISGGNYHYRVNPDGSYLLYSVGWNGKDDGGTVVDEKGNSAVPRIDYTQGDWVWFGPR